ncbi:MAG: molybdenum cofactor biosynthesis protein MoaE [Alphaproteobacteria bacterium]|nr:molybdenum cofactor biosynthesis protein MoaE [Alphaproteobacteria bacterium]
MIRVQEEDFDIGAELAALSAGDTSIGGVASFAGLVRDMAPIDGTVREITTMTLEHYPGMTEKKLVAIEAEANDRWPLAASLIIHRYGTLAPGDQIVLVACASVHRQAAFDACQFLMDWLKTDAPFWKLEDTDAGGVWVDTRDSDGKAKLRWANKPDPAS